MSKDPRYSTEGLTWSKLSEGTSGKDKEELDALETIDSCKMDTIPHQVESIKHWQNGKHIVVATGTGSGKPNVFFTLC